MIFLRPFTPPGPGDHTRPSVVLAATKDEGRLKIFNSPIRGAEGHPLLWLTMRRFARKFMDILREVKHEV